MLIQVSSLGCRLNQSEIQSVITVLRDRGHIITSDYAADAFIVNSCKVTLHSERKTRKLIYRARRACGNDTGRLIIVTGCCADRPFREANIYYIPNDFKHLIPDIIDGIIDISEVHLMPPERFSYPVPVKATTTRINLKIQDGCDNFCSYCIIPYARGGPRSKSIDQVQSEFKSLLAAGYKEIVLTGVMIGKYLHGTEDLTRLVKTLLIIEGDYRLHLTSLSPAHVSDELITLMANDRVVRHLNLSLQSGSDVILKRMNRNYTAAKYLSLVKKIRAIDQKFNLTTDVIVGFPGESDSDFSETVSLIKEAGFSHIHTFRFSPRPGTEAAGFTDDVSEEIKRIRSEEVIALYHRQKDDYYRAFHKWKSVLLSEKSYKGKTRGFNEYYVPIEMDSLLERNKFFRITTRHKQGSARLSGSLSE